MSGTNFQGFAQQAQEKVQEAVNTVDKTAKDATDQAIHKCQEEMNKVCQQAGEGLAKAAEHTAKATSDLHKKFNL